MAAPIPETLPSAAYMLHPSSKPTILSKHEFARNIGISNIMIKSKIAKFTMSTFEGVRRDLDLEIMVRFVTGP